MKKNAKKHLLLTIIISCLLILFVSGMFYVIYCYGFYNKYQDNMILEYYTSFKFNELYKYFETGNKEYLSKEMYDKVTDLTFNKINLEKIYNSYYKDSDIYENKEELFKKFYFRYYDVLKKDISMSYSGKTNLFERRDVFVNGIIVKNGYNEESYFGIVKDVKFVIEGISSLKLDDKTITCSNECVVDYMFGGIHEIEYESNGFTYYGLINIFKNEQEVAVAYLDNLVTIEQKVSLDLNNFNKVEVNESKALDIGLYGLIECNLDSGCPSTKYTYISLNTDGTCTYYFYVTLDKAGDTYDGTYKFENGFLKMNFESHTYSVFDYDMKQKTDIVATTDIKMTFKIESNNTFRNNDFSFVKKA